jgi:anaerobic selenocysteine-containing dehydrogenase
VHELDPFDEVHHEARRRGAKIVVIDPIFTQTAAKADEYWEIKPGMDGALALGMARHLLDLKMEDQTWLDENAEGYSEFASYLRREITVDWAAEQSGIPAERIKQITRICLCQTRHHLGWLRFAAPCQRRRKRPRDRCLRSHDWQHW